jgi:polyferredoxin
MDQEKKTFFEQTQDLTEDYIKNRLWLLRLQTAEKSARLVSLVLTGLVLGLLGFFVLLFLSIMAGYFFAQLTGSLFYGFGLVTLFYLLLVLILIKLRKKYLEKWITDRVIRIFFDSSETDDGP